ncbi:YbjP/YqhG family protein [Streptomyces sp. 891-h]|uniref:YbjP/YqhG family protein n=1 Tax=Streptomyces sp. 891-h TaxID=2720714 RepID=UPI001FAADC03|nr:YbjP/YqhG family protein [Streptomyces sp. 891-h]UNZ22301.1 hypothetical protein HC362_34605 [Streptomyces sp. 891-h]
MRDLRSTLTWVLHSRRRLLGTVVSLVAAIVLIASLNNEDGQRHADAKAPRPSTSSSSEPPASSSPSPSSSPDLSTAAGTARGFVAAWASHKPRQEWLASLAPHATQDLTRDLSSTDPERISSTKATKATVTDTGGGNITSVAVRTDAGPVTVDLLWERGRWWVYDIQPGAQAKE